MTVSAVDPQITGMQLMTVRNRLDRTVADIRIIRGSVIPEETDDAYQDNGGPDCSQEW